jgi:4-diphosphocytidyl-2-C-methyl-D-erythritol kinase
VHTNALKLPSFAKINWTLQVLGKRPDGYHELVTVLQTVSLHDDLTFEIRDDDERIDLSSDDPSIPVDTTNLVSKAAISLRAHTGKNKGAYIHLAKQIPAQAGLGGGSSNAAVTLMGLNELWRCGLSLSELAAIATTIGSDVPFFLTAGTAKGEGTGTRLSSLPDVPKRHLLIVSPRAKVATNEAYATLNRPSLTSYNPISILARSFEGSNLADCDQWPLKNDFEDVIFEIEPEIRRAKQALLDSGARGALLAGSGSSVFGIFADEEARNRGLDSLNLEKGWRLFSCDTISRAEYFTAFDLPFLRSSENTF